MTPRQELQSADCRGGAAAATPQGRAAISDPPPLISDGDESERRKLTEFVDRAMVYAEDHPQGELRMALSRRDLLAVSIPLVLAGGAAHAQSAGGAPETISRFYVVLLEVMKAGKQAPFQQRYQTLAPAVDEAFDLQGILRVSVGAYWSSLPPDQQQTLFTVFRAFTIANYVSNFHSYKGRVLDVSPTTRAIGSQQVVTTTITKPGRDPLRIDYVLRNESAGWKVVDVLLDGTISRVAVQRSDFSSLVSSGNARPLIATLKTKVSNLSDGAITA